MLDSGATPVALCIALLLTFALELAVLRRLGFDWIVTAIVVLGTALSIRYGSYTTIDERNYDGSSQIEYIRFITEHGGLPSATTCGVCGHPPLYYLLGAAWGGLTGAWLPLEVALQWLSLLLSVGFLTFSLLLVRGTMKGRAGLWLAALLLAFWPSAIIHSVRVHNDALASLLMVAALHWLAEWDRERRSRWFWAAVASSALALLTKGSGYAVALVVAAFAFLPLLSQRTRTRAAALRGAIVALVLPLAGFLAVAFRDRSGTGFLCSTILGPSCRGRYVPPIPDTWDRFVAFHPVDFVSQLETVPTDPFLNRFLKSILFGVAPLGQDFASARATTVAVGLSGLLLLMIALCSWGALAVPSASLRRHRVAITAAAVSGACLLAFRIRLPNEFHEDFRHIFAALALLCLAYCRLIERARSRPFAALGRTAALLMAAASVVFFAPGP